MVRLSKKGYQNGKIYFIGNYKDNDIYIGHTTQTLKRRFQRHKENTRNDKLNKRKLYAKMLERGIEHFYIEEIEKYPCNSLEELEKRERHYILEKQPVLNIQIPQRKMEEWRQDNKENLQQYERQRHHNNPRTEYRKEYREKKRDELNEYNKQYREEHPEYFKEYNKEYRKNHPEYFKVYDEKKKETITCECGKVITRGSMSRHCKSKFHQNYLNNNIDVSEEKSDNNELSQTNE